MLWFWIWEYLFLPFLNCMSSFSTFSFNFFVLKIVNEKHVHVPLDSCAGNFWALAQTWISFNSKRSLNINTTWVSSSNGWNFLCASVKGTVFDFSGQQCTFPLKICTRLKSVALSLVQCTLCSALQKYLTSWPFSHLVIFIMTLLDQSSVRLTRESMFGNHLVRFCHRFSTGCRSELWLDHYLPLQCYLFYLIFCRFCFQDFLPSFTCSILSLLKKSMGVFCHLKTPAASSSAINPQHWNNVNPHVFWA